ncbi:unnamed protein product [Paramecium sonneborni]|uniref:Uncharacterized protein n=1 Tax=Paramecium sonneborni TaxID=65129 RepID=A0A8S1PGF9_9CILI|nr:unnamed protein product [Paramecium sonneborni]
MTKLIYFLESQQFELKNIMNLLNQVIQTCIIRRFLNIQEKFLINRGMECANNQRTLAEKQSSLNYIALQSCLFDDLNQEVYDYGSDGYRPIIQRFDKERLIYS